MQARQPPRLLPPRLRVNARPGRFAELAHVAPDGDGVNKSLSCEGFQHGGLVPACREPFVLHTERN